jgi:hypothetical protein
MSNAYGGRAWEIHNLGKTTFLRHEDPDHFGEWVDKGFPKEQEAA